MLEKWIPSKKVGLTQVADAVCFTNGQKFINKIQKLINDRKTMFSIQTSLIGEWLSI
jgi:2-oxoglutarate dehydrogenase E1 component